MLKTCILLCLGVLISLSPNAYATDIEWETVDSPANTSLSSFKVDANGNIYAAGQAYRNKFSLSRTTDFGKSWQFLWRPEDGTLRNIEFLARDDRDRLYLGGSIGLFIEGTDEEPLLAIDCPLGHDDPHCLFWRSLLFTDDGTMFLGGSRGVFRSGDYGSAWESLSSRGFEEVSTVTSLVKQSDGDIYAAVKHKNSVYRSSDGGDSWTPLPIPPHRSGWYNFVDKLVVNSRDEVYALVRSVGVYRLQEGATDWEWVYGEDTGGSKCLRGLAINSLDHIFISGCQRYVIRSTDNAESWQDITQNLPEYTLALGGALALDGSGHLYVHINGGIVRSKTSTLDFTPTSVDHTAVPELSARPNPATDALVIDLGAEMRGQIDVYDGLGRLVLARDVNAERRLTLNVAAFPPGRYVATLRSSNTAGLPELIPFVVLR